ncbi:hypothetical protein F4678DRAFT_462673 [Xylaria arbuscula]|nr:hypothetical protein F4678DRAFT_462673 [Xylaria arbuscula]
MPTSTVSSSVNSAALAPSPASPPLCFLYSKANERIVTQSSNRNGNAGRPYYKCTPCNNFLVFADERGNDPTNPECHCGFSSKRQITGRSDRVAGLVHYVCRLGECDYYNPSRDESGIATVIAANLIDDLSKLSII